MEDGIIGSRYRSAKIDLLGIAVFAAGSEPRCMAKEIGCAQEFAAKVGFTGMLRLDWPGFRTAVGADERSWLDTFGRMGMRTSRGLEE